MSASPCEVTAERLWQNRERPPGLDDVLKRTRFNFVACARDFHAQVQALRIGIEAPTAPPLSFAVKRLIHSTSTWIGIDRFAWPERTNGSERDGVDPKRDGTSAD